MSRYKFKGVRDVMDYLFGSSFVSNVQVPFILDTYRKYFGEEYKDLAAEIIGKHEEDGRLNLEKVLDEFEKGALIKTLDSRLDGLVTKGAHFEIKDKTLYLVGKECEDKTRAEYPVCDIDFEKGEVDYSKYPWKNLEDPMGYAVTKDVLPLVFGFNVKNGGKNGKFI